MGRARRRLLGLAVVAGSLAASAAYASLTFTELAPTSNPIPVSAPGNVVFSTRNTGPGSVMITGILESSDQTFAGTGCLKMMVAPLDTTLPHTLAQGEQMQFVVHSIGFPSPGMYDCKYDLMTNPAVVPTPQVRVLFQVSSSPGSADVQARAFDFGTQAAPGFEQQKVVVTNYGAPTTMELAISGDAAKNFTFLAPCDGLQVCDLSMPGFGSGSGGIYVKCAAKTTGDVLAMLAVTGALGGPPVYGSASLHCATSGSGGGSGIDIVDTTIAITSAIGVPGSATTDVVAVGGPDSIAGAMLTGGDASFSITGCGQLCAFMPAMPLPQTLQLNCTPSATMTSATLTVYDPGGGSDAATVTCTPSGGGPILAVMQSSLAFGTLAVGAMTTQMLEIKNTGGAELQNVRITFPGTFGGDYTASDCVTMDCNIGSGSSQFVTVTFQPTAHGDRSSTLQVDSNDPDPTRSPATVTLAGSATGGVLEITSPTGPPYDLDLGTIPRGQLFSRNITVANGGNAQLEADLAGATAPLSTMPATLSVFPGNPQAFTVSCMSATASAANDQTLSLTSPDAYAGGSQSVTVHCAIADTVVQISPQTFDFGEVRTGSPMWMLTVTITNPSTATATAQLHHVRLASSKTGLTLTPADTQLALAPGDTATAVLALSTTTDSDLAGEQLDIDVDAASLHLPVTGKVVTAKSRVAPAVLDLGTACVGTQVTGTAMLVNEGTATLAIQAPQMDRSFLALYQTPTNYPSQLAPGAAAVAAVTPASSSTSTLTGTLTWDDDVPSHYAIPVMLDYIANGTAVSPRALDFGTLDVDASASPQQITLQNCSVLPVTMAIKRLRTTEGPGGAWVIEPRIGFTKLLGQNEKQSLTVTFRPKVRGHYEAELELDTGAGTQFVHLVADASGSDPDATSFYACACSGPGAPSHGWPILVAVVLVLRRRRQRTMIQP